MLKQSILLLLIVTPGLTGCNINSQHSDESQYVVEAYLVANQTLPSIRLSETQPAFASYSFQDGAVSNAIMEIHLLNESGSTEQTFPYELKEPGIYKPTIPHNVIPEKSYELEISFPNDPAVITAQTIIPGTVEIQEGVVDTIDYQSSEEITLYTTPSYYPGRQSYFVFNFITEHPQSDNLTPFYKDQVENQDADISDFAKNSSGILNEQNYTKTDDGMLELNLPWIAIAFYGQNQIVVNALDDNIYDFYRSQSVQSGSDPFSRVNIQNVITHIDGAIGVFGSLATDSVDVYIRRSGP